MEAMPESNDVELADQQTVGRVEWQVSTRAMGQYQPYPPEVSAELEAAYKDGEPKTTITVDGITYSVELQGTTLTEVPLSGGQKLQTRFVRRVVVDASPREDKEHYGMLKQSHRTLFGVAVGINIALNAAASMLLTRNGTGPLFSELPGLFGLACLVSALSTLIVGSYRLYGKEPPLFAVGLLGLCGVIKGGRVLVGIGSAMNEFSSIGRTSIGGAKNAEQVVVSLIFVCMAPVLFVVALTAGAIGAALALGDLVLFIESLTAY